MPASDAVVLPETASPSKYRIKLQPDLKNFTFDGEQSVDIQILEPTSTIVLNAIDLQIEHDLIEIYYSELIERGVANYSVDQLEDDFRWALFHSMIMSIRLSVNMAEQPVLRFEDRLEALVDWDCMELLK